MMFAKSSTKGIWAAFLLSLSFQGKDAVVFGQQPYTRDRESSAANSQALRQRKLLATDANIAINGGASAAVDLPQYSPTSEDATAYGVVVDTPVATGEVITCTLTCTGPTSRANAIVLRAWYDSFPASNIGNNPTTPAVQISVFELACPVSFTTEIDAVNNGKKLHVAYFLDDIETAGPPVLTGSQLECRKPTKSPTASPGTAATPAPTASPTAAGTNSTGCGFAEAAVSKAYNWLFH